MRLASRRASFRCPGRAVLADGEPALPSADSELDQIDAVAPLAADAEALHVGVPGDAAGGERIDGGLGDLARTLGHWLL